MLEMKPSQFASYLRIRGRNYHHENGSDFMAVLAGDWPNFYLEIPLETPIASGDTITGPGGETYMVFGVNAGIVCQEAPIKKVLTRADVLRASPERDGFGRSLGAVTVAASVPVIWRSTYTTITAYIPSRYGVQAGDLIISEERSRAVLSEQREFGISCLRLAPRHLDNHR